MVLGHRMPAPFRPWIVIAPLALLTGAAVSGCTWVDSLRGDGFQTWNQTLGNCLRGNPNATQPSGFFTDSRSDQIEQNLGGGF